jgi:hypothetical protein
MSLRMLKEPPLAETYVKDGESKIPILGVDLLTASCRLRFLSRFFGVKPVSLRQRSLCF